MDTINTYLCRIEGFKDKIIKLKEIELLQFLFRGEKYHCVVQAQRLLTNGKNRLIKANGCFGRYHYLSPADPDETAKGSTGMRYQRNRNISSTLKGWGFSLIVALLVATSFKSAIADWNDIPSGSMMPTILIGDRVFVNKLAYDLKVPFTSLHLKKWSDPRRGDIVVFYSPQDATRMIKRVVGLPGDTLALRQNRLFINGRFVTYGPLAPELLNQIEADQQSDHVFFNEKLPGKPHAVMFTPSRPSLDTLEPVAIPAGRYFMLGDNRDNSADSRFFGLVDRKLIVGRASRIVLSREGSFLHPRWRRFFKKLM